MSARITLQRLLGIYRDDAGVKHPNDWLIEGVRNEQIRRWIVNTDTNSVRVWVGAFEEHRALSGLPPRNPPCQWFHGQWCEVRRDEAELILRRVRDGSKV